MNHVAIVYWSGTGNTEAMASCIADGVREAGGEVTLLGPGEFSAARFSELCILCTQCVLCHVLLGFIVDKHFSNCFRCV